MALGATSGRGRSPSCVTTVAVRRDGRHGRRRETCGLQGGQGEERHGPPEQHRRDQGARLRAVVNDGETGDGARARSEQTAASREACSIKAADAAAVVGDRATFHYGETRARAAQGRST